MKMPAMSGDREDKSPMSVNAKTIHDFTVTTVRGGIGLC